MHLLILIVALLVAYQFREITAIFRNKSQISWQKSLFCFAFPPLFLLMAALAVISMGYDGMMFGLRASWVSYGVAIAFLGWSVGLGAYRLWQAIQSLQEMKQYPLSWIKSQPTRILETPFPYSAQIGLWNPQLVMSQGLLDTLDEEHLDAVLAHENAHSYYRDTFWFFCLGWLRQITFWLPQTEELWQELLFIRELRADQKAAENVDPLLLAEALMVVAQTVQQTPVLPQFDAIAAALHQEESRLITRINYLVDPAEVANMGNQPFNWVLLALALIPLILIPLHS
ncbi:MAG: M56 family metallopeptidase [Snowella sp.]|nr:M56 family metallopeptidase [Snowella sp.]